MKIDLNTLGSKRHIAASLPPDSIDLENEHARVAGEVGFDALVEKAAGVIALRGTLSADVELDCDRCLEPYRRPAAIDLDLEFAEPELFAEASVELDSDDMKLDALSDAQIDLAAVAREQILLDLPQQAFCREDCKGLCPGCGENLNLTDCSCGEAEIDPRWAALKDLKR